jgi:RHS repeat-associated protein
MKFLIPIILTSYIFYSSVQAQPSTDRNFVVKTEIKRPGIVSQEEINQLDLPLSGNRQVSYFDGLGRPVQNVIVHGSINNRDIVTPVEYDNYGREIKKFLPYVDQGGGSGSFKMHAAMYQSEFYSPNYTDSDVPKDLFPFAQTFVEFSPIGKPLENGHAGATWQPGSGHTVGAIHSFNTAQDGVRKWLVAETPNDFATYKSVEVYQNNDLFKSISHDENGNQVIEFKDKEGKLVLKKVQLTAEPDKGGGSGHEGWLNTYYLYDDINQLRCVIQPRGVKLISATWGSLEDETILNEQCFRYEYDERQRMIIKKVPGAAPVYMLYDKWDRLVLTQDGNLRISGKWMFTKYDQLNRPVYTGLLSAATSLAEIKAHLEQSELGRFETFSPQTGFQYSLDKSYPSFSSLPLLLAVTFYDDYKFTASLGEVFRQKDNGHDSKFFSPGESPLYAEPLTQSLLTKGMVTGKLVYQLKDNVALYYSTSVIFYDEKGRVLQTVSDNISGGIDINTTQYNFIGQPLRNITHHEMKMGSKPALLNTVYTTMEYDDFNRLLLVKKQIIQKLNGVKYGSNEKLLLKNEYNSLGTLKTKSLGVPEEGNTLESLNFDYNIRGWLTGVNKNYITAPEQYSNFFGMELAYDRTNAADESTAYLQGQVNGNIAGTIWRTRGDEVSRKYDYTYDKANRLMSAVFEQKNTGAGTWDNSTVNFSVLMGENGQNPESAYDENGNILRMQQWGLKLNSSSKIDDLLYTYANGHKSNKLQNVIDLQNEPTTTLGDFRTSANHPQASAKAQGTIPRADIVDYQYDVNGNLGIDKNKDIHRITYNILNLPEKIELNNDKGHISYQYDAAGNKLIKTTVDEKTESKTITTTTKYVSGFVYETKTTIPFDENAPDYTDKLLFTGHEEGRIRYNAVTEDEVNQGKQPTFCFDYFIKDQLGNVRMVLTDEGKEDQYPAATLETANLANEKTFYNIPSNSDTRKNKTDVAGYPQNDNTTSPNDFVQRLIGNGTKVGSSIVLKVMSGDKFNVKVSSWYKTNGSTTPDNPQSPLENLVSTLARGIASASTGGHPVNPEDLEQGSVLPMALEDFLSDPNQINPDLTRPKAYLNWILFDEQFQYVSSGSGAEQVPAESVYENNTANVHVFDYVRSDLPITKNGYLYVYVSNETPNIPVFFDNLQVTHYRGVIFDETHYYPFGLTMSGISSKAAGITPNKIKFNGIELNTELDINIYEANLRNLDPQTGRWWQIDPKAEEMVMWSTYASNFDNPIRYQDNFGDKPGGCCDPLTDFIVSAALHLVNGASNLKAGANNMAASQAGGNDNLPVPVQKIKSVEAKAQVAAGVAELLQPALEATAQLGLMATGIETPGIAPIVSKAGSSATTAAQATFGKAVLGSAENVPVSNPIPKMLARVVPNVERPLPTLGTSSSADVFVTAASEIKNLNAAQIADKLTIPLSSSGFRIYQFPTPTWGIASPVNRLTEGFVGKGRTAGNAVEFVIPNQVIPANATTTIVR